MEYGNANFYSIDDQFGTPMFMQQQPQQQPQQPTTNASQQKLTKAAQGQAIPATISAPYVSYQALQQDSQQMSQGAQLAQSAHAPYQGYYTSHPTNKVQPVQQKKQSGVDKLFSKKKEILKLLIFATMIAFAISLAMVFLALIKYLKSTDKIVTVTQEFWITVVYSVCLFVLMWCVKSFAS